MNILISRKAARGDVIIASATAAAIKHLYPDSCIYFDTLYKDVLENHPHIDFVIDLSVKMLTVNMDLIYDLNMTAELKPNTNLLLAFAEVMNLKVENCSLIVSESSIILPDLKYIVMHLGTAIRPGRSWFYYRWQHIGNKLKSLGYQVITIGSIYDNYLIGSLDLRDKLDVNQLAFLLRHAILFIGVESFPFHVAQAVYTTSVIFTGSVHPYRVIVRDNVYPVFANQTSCLGCLHRQPTPCTGTFECETHDLRCETRVSTDQMWETIVKALQSRS